MTGKMIAATLKKLDAASEYYNGDIELQAGMEQLCKDGLAIITVKTPRGETVMSRTVSSEDTETVRMLLRRESDRVCRHMEDALGCALDTLRQLVCDLGGE